MIAISLGSVICDSISRDSLEWELVRIFWVLWCSKWGCLGKSNSLNSYPWSIVLGVNITITVVISVCLGTVISDSISGDSLERKLVRVQWVLWCSKRGSLFLGKSNSLISNPWSIVLGVNVTISIMISVSLGSVICDSISRDGLEWKLVRVQWVLWCSKRGSLFLGKSNSLISFPWSIVLGVNVTITIMISISLWSIVCNSISGDSLEWKLVGVQWVLWCSKWGGLFLGKSNSLISFPWSIVLGVNITITVVVTVSLGSIISDSISRDGLERKLVGVQWVLWSSEWSSLSLRINLN